MRAYLLMAAMILAAQSAGCVSQPATPTMHPRHTSFTASNVARLRAGVTTVDDAKALFGQPDQVEVETRGQATAHGPWQAMVLTYRMGVPDPAFTQSEAVNVLVFELPEASTPAPASPDEPYSMTALRQLQADEDAKAPPWLNSYEIPIIYP
jgi:hypothetical protein